MTSILNSIKKLLGIGEEDTSFDEDIILHINAAFMTLNQLGIGSPDGVLIEDGTATWDAILGTRADIAGVKLYVTLKVRLMFDPPTSSYVLDAMERQVKELEWRLNMQVENNPEVAV